MGPCSTNRIFGTRRNVAVLGSLLSLLTYSLVSCLYFRSSMLPYVPNFSSQRNVKRDEGLIKGARLERERLDGLRSNSKTNITSSLIVSLTPIDICFVSSIFAPTTKTADRPHDMTNFQLDNTTSFQFFLYTNLDDLKSPGWTKVLRNFTYRRFITQSRWGKFMAWKDPEMKACQTIFYFDGHFTPDGNKTSIFAQLAKEIRESEFGLAQTRHPSKRRTAIAEFDAVLKLKKDIKKNVNASIEWLQAQPDFYNNCTLYQNTYFGYDPTNIHFQRAAEYFWNHYSKEEDSWRDQPLWCHTLERSHIKPIRIGKSTFREDHQRKGHKGHRHGAAQDNDATPKSEAAKV